MELDTQTFINSMDALFTSNWTILKTALMDADALIAGGGVLTPYINCNVYDINDLDIYIHLSKVSDFILVLRSLNYILDTEGNYITPAYDQSFFRKNNIIARFRLYNQITNYIPIDVMIIPDEIPILSVVTNFDLTCCEIWYDGTRVLAVDPEGILHRTCELKKDYVDGFLNSLNLFTIKRMQKYMKKGFTISYDALKIRNTFVKKSKNVTSPEEWVIYTLYNWILRRLNMPTRLSIVCNYPIHKYTVRNFEDILPVLKTYIPGRYVRGLTTDRDLYMKILFNIRYSKLSYTYKTYIHDILGISNDDMIAYEEGLTPPIPNDGDGGDGDDGGYGGGDDGDGDSGGNFLTPPRVSSLAIYDDYNNDDDSGEFEQTDDIDERDMNIEGQTCRDVILSDDIPIQEYLETADTFLFINKSSTDDILCYEKSYIETILDNKSNWFYECTGRLLDDGNRAIQVGNENDAYIKLPLYKDGLNGFIHLSQVRRLLESDNRIYYVYPDDIDITHSISWVNAFGPDHQRNWVSANHCQVGSKLLIYKLKICRDPERCLTSSPPRVTSVRTAPTRRVLSEDFDRVASSPPRQPSEDFDRVPSVRASPRRLTLIEYNQ